jgi:hypothetical protein
MNPRVDQCKYARIVYMGTLTVPYSFSYDAATQLPGSLPCFLTGTNAAPSLNAIIGPRRNPRASRPTTASIFPDGELAIVCDVR